MPKRANKRAKRKGKTMKELTISYEKDELANNLAKVKGEKPVPFTLKRARDAQASDAGRKAKKARKEATASKMPANMELDEDGLGARQCRSSPSSLDLSTRLLLRSVSWFS